MPLSAAFGGGVLVVLEGAAERVGEVDAQQVLPLVPPGIAAIGLPAQRK
jgi:hypothetical protein